LSSASLTAIVRYRALYPEERSKIPIEAVLQKMKRDITIRSIVARDGSVPAFSVGFAYRDRFVAQDVTQDLVVRLIDANTRSEATPHSNFWILHRSPFDRSAWIG
jgi:hypothetical protein